MNDGIFILLGYNHILKETFEWIVLAGCVFVGAGIYIANTKRSVKKEV